MENKEERVNNSIAELTDGRVLTLTQKTKDGKEEEVLVMIKDELSLTMAKDYLLRKGAPWKWWLKKVGGYVATGIGTGAAIIGVEAIAGLFGGESDGHTDD